MLHFIYGHNLMLMPDLAKGMFRDRASQFAARLKWDVQVDKMGLERDAYDRLNPLYIIATDPHGKHLGSMRFLPTVGRTMINDHFRKLYEGPEICSPRTWECTRFCLAPGARPIISLKLLAAGGRLMRELGLDELIAVFDDRMSRVYRRSGVSPETLGEGPYKGARVSVGRWTYTNQNYKKLLQLSETDEVEMELAVANSDLNEELRLYA